MALIQFDTTGLEDLLARLTTAQAEHGHDEFGHDHDVQYATVDHAHAEIGRLLARVAEVYTTLTAAIGQINDQIVVLQRQEETDFILLDERLKTASREDTARGEALRLLVAKASDDLGTKYLEAHDETAAFGERLEAIEGYPATVGGLITERVAAISGEIDRLEHELTLLSQTQVAHTHTEFKHDHDEFAGLKHTHKYLPDHYHAYASPEKLADGTLVYRCTSPGCPNVFSVAGG